MRRVIEKGFLVQREEPNSHLLHRVNRCCLFLHLWHRAAFPFGKRFLPSWAQLLGAIPHCIRYPVCKAAEFLRLISLRTAVCTCRRWALTLVHIRVFQRTVQEVHSSHIALMRIQIWLCWGEWRVCQAFKSSGYYILLLLQCWCWISKLPLPKFRKYFTHFV